MPVAALLVVAADVADDVSESATSMVDYTLDLLPRLGVALVFIALGWAISRLVRSLSRRAMAGRRSPSFARVMSKVFGWLFLFGVVLVAVAITFPSVQPVDLLAGLGFFSVAIGFAFQDILENTLAGVLLLFRQPFVTGDQIEVQEYTGTVEGITIRETRITTFDGQLVVIPNRDVYKSAIRVQTHHELLRSEFTVGIAYENDPDDARRAIVDVLAEVDGVLATPAPSVLVSELGVSTVNLCVRLWSESRQWDRLQVLDAAIRATKRALDEAGIEMPAEIIVLQASPSFKAAIQGEAEVTPGGAVRADGKTPNPRGG